MRTNYGDLSIDINPTTGRAKSLPNRPPRDTRGNGERGQGTRVTNHSGGDPSPRPISGDQPKYRSKLEARYAGHLDAQRTVGEIREVRYESLTVKLAKHTTLTPDFLLDMPDRTVEIHEVKGQIREDAWVKLKVAASLWPWFRWFVVTRKKGEWIIKRVPSA